MKKNTYIAALALLIIGGFAFWIEKSVEEHNPEKAFNISPSDIVRVEIWHQEKQLVVLEKNDDSFRLTTPIDAETDPKEVDLLVSNLSTINVIRTLNDRQKTDRKDYGLTESSLNIRFTTSSDITNEIRFGNHTLTPRHQYAEFNTSNNIQIVSSHYSANLNKSSWDLRNKTIFAINEGAKPTSLMISRENQTLQLTRFTETETWHITSPLRARANNTLITSMITQLSDTQMVALANDFGSDLENIGLKSPLLRIKVGFSKHVNPLLLDIGAENELGYYATVPSQQNIFSIEKAIVHKFQKDVYELASEKLFESMLTNVKELSIVNPSGVTKTLSSGESAMSIVQALNTINSEKPVPLRANDQVLYVIRINTRKETVEFRISERTKDEIYVTRKGEQLSFRLNRNSWTKLQSYLTENSG